MFGTAILPAGVRPDGTARMGPLFSLISLHKAYARLLLDRAARACR